MRPPRSMLLPAALLIGGAVPFLAGTEHTNSICVMSSSGCFDSYSCTNAGATCPEGGSNALKKRGFAISFGSCVGPFPPNVCATGSLPCYAEKYYTDSGCSAEFGTKWNMALDACQ